jgi:hypothetical protein
MNTHSEILLIVCLSGTLPYIFPMGLIDLMNRLSVSKLGLYSWEVTEKEIRHARIVLIPVHWFYSIPSAIQLAKQYKKWNPDLIILTGGYTATVFDKEIIASTAFDYIIRGDAELIISQFIQALLENRNVENFPNITSKNWQTPISSFISTLDLDKGNYRNIEWFPTFQKMAISSQRIKEINYLYPWIPVTRGCRFHCSDCMASDPFQKKIFGRGMIFRSEKKIQEDLFYFHERKDIHYCYFNSDIIHMLGMESACKIFENFRYDLECYYEWYQYPSLEKMELLQRSFNKLTIGLFLQKSGECVNDTTNPFKDNFLKLKSLLYTLEKYKNLKILLYTDLKEARVNSLYRDSAIHLARFSNVRMNHADNKIFPDLSVLDADKIYNLYTGLLHKAESEIPEILSQQRWLIPLLRIHPWFSTFLFRFAHWKNYWQLQLS